jgi:hypothetical protein
VFGSGPFPELDVLERLAQRGAPALRCEVVGEIQVGRWRLPLHCLELGSTSPDVPAVGFFGGVHGLERVGSQVLLTLLHSLVERIGWDSTLAQMLERVTLVFMPIVNPGGMLMRLRANPLGVDLMRNAPVEADRGDAAFLVGGQRTSPMLPWYRGAVHEPMQAEATALCEAVRARVLSHRFALTLDCHSGFGAHDRIWFPYACSRRPIECLPEIYALRTMFRTTHPYHDIYIIEPQSRQYLTHGDLWDHLYDTADRVPGSYIPLTLEMGSWIWVKKRPGQIFSSLGMFNPVVPHRLRRTMRRHLTLFDFLIRAAISHRAWVPAPDGREALREIATAYWYRSPVSGRPHMA